MYPIDHQVGADCRDDVDDAQDDGGHVRLDGGSGRFEDGDLKSISFECLGFNRILTEF